MATQQEQDLVLDVSPETARALHRVVRAMHDGHCPDCGHLDQAIAFRNPPSGGGYRCPSCNFTIQDYEAKAALREFSVYLKKSHDVFEIWRAEMSRRRSLDNPGYQSR